MVEKQSYQKKNGNSRVNIKSYQFRQTGKPLPTTQLILKDTNTLKKAEIILYIGLAPLKESLKNSKKLATTRKTKLRNVLAKCMDSNHVGSAPT